MLGLPSGSAKWLIGSSLVFWATIAGGTIAFAADESVAEPAPAVDPVPAVGNADESKPSAEPQVDLTPDPPGLTRLAKEAPLWVDLKRKLVVLDGEVILREGTLEMFACNKGTKEHESVVVVNCKPHFVHTALLALGVKPGSGARFDPMYVPAKGPIIDIFVLWKDSDGKEHRQRAQDWIKSLKTGKAMEFDWVFGGSGFWKDEDTGEMHYQADGGEFICVSNFPTAMLDLPVPSSQSNDALNFTAFTENIPPRGTKVRLVLSPRESKPEGGAPTEDKPAAETPPTEKPVVDETKPVDEPAKKTE